MFGAESGELGAFSSFYSISSESDRSAIGPYLGVYNKTDDGLLARTFKCMAFPASSFFNFHF